MADNNITRVAVVLTALVNDTPRTFTANLDLNAFSDEIFLGIKRQAQAYFKAAAAAATAPLETTRS